MEETNQGGAPTKYHDDMPRMARIACEEGGFTDVKLAKLFNVSKSTINNWKKDHPEFKDALKIGKDTFDSERVETAFLKRCLGFRFTEVTREPAVIKKHLDGRPPDVLDTKMVVTKKVSKIIVPDGKSCMDWLTNRQPQRWKKVKHVEVTGAGGGPIKTDSLVAVPSGPMSIEQWEKEVAAARKHDKDIEPGQIPGNA